MTHVTPPAHPTQPRPRSRPARRPSLAPGSELSPATRRTMIALTASALAIVPLRALFRDVGWMIDVWLTMLVVIGPAALIRRRRPPGALDIWPGIVLLIPWLTFRFLHEGAVAGIVPTGETWHQLSVLMTDLHDTTRQEVAPIHSTTAVTLVVCALLGLLAALVDLIAVVGRRGALAGVPLLVVYTVAGAVPRKPVSWLWFAIAAIGYLLLLALDASDDLDHWGRRVSTSGGGRARSALSVAAPRIAAAAIAVAVLLPVLVPGDSRNLLANAFHSGSGSGVGGFGGSGGGSISPFAALKGQLDRDKPVKLATVHMVSSGDTAPFYLRVNVLSEYTSKGWGVSSHGETNDADTGAFGTEPDGVTPDTVSLEARLKVTALRGNPPVFDRPVSVHGLDSDTTWSPQDQILLGSTVDDGQDFTEQFAQPTPTLAQLQSAPNDIDESVRSQLEVPDNFPAFAKNLVDDTVEGKRTPYAKARAISDFFADSRNGFSYDLQTQNGDSGSDLIDFLQNRRGFCQQYAAAMAIMLRSAGVPARVVLGYTHDAPDRNGDFTITTNNAHSWVEAWFAGIGWVPFDPTPADTSGGGGRDQLAWAPKSSQASLPSLGSASQTANSRSSSRAGARSNGAANPGATTSGSGSDPSTVPIWIAVAVLALAAVALVPSGVRWTRRRRRYASARRDGDPDALWAELSDTAVDLGYIWSPARSPRQVATWLSKDASGSAGALRSLADAVEHRRYAPGTVTTAPPGGLVDDLRGVTDELRSRRSGRTRFRARFLPASLGWTSLSGFLGGRGRRNH